MARRAPPTPQQGLSPSEEGPALGHNRPPRPDLDSPEADWVEHLDNAYAALAAEKKALLERFERLRERFPLKSAGPTSPPAGVDKWNDALAGQVGDFRDALRALVKNATALHTLEKDPILKVGRLVDGHKNKFLSDLLSLDSRGKMVPGASQPLNWITDTLTLYLQHVERVARQAAAAEAERARKEADEAAQAAAQRMDPVMLESASEKLAQAAEAEQRAVAPVADLSRVHGDFGSTSSLRRRFEFVESESELSRLVAAVAAGVADIKYLSFNTTAIGYAVRSENLRSLPGCVIREATRA